MILPKKRGVELTAEVGVIVRGMQHVATATVTSVTSPSATPADPATSWTPTASVKVCRLASRL